MSEGDRHVAVRGGRIGFSDFRTTFLVFGFLGFAMESVERSESPPSSSSSSSSSSEEEDDDADDDDDELESFFERRPSDTTALGAFFEVEVEGLQRTVEPVLSETDRVILPVEVEFCFLD
jgi:hypothetical protein